MANNKRSKKRAPWPTNSGSSPLGNTQYQDEVSLQYFIGDFKRRISWTETILRKAIGHVNETPVSMSFERSHVCQVRDECVFRV